MFTWVCRRAHVCVQMGMSERMYECGSTCKHDVYLLECVHECVSTWVCAPVCDVYTHDCARLSVQCARGCQLYTCLIPPPFQRGNHPVLLSHFSDIQIQARRHHTLAGTPVPTEAPVPGCGRGRAATLGLPGAMRGMGPVLGVRDIRRTGAVTG